ncbi:MAG: Rrf2 family transcriptional regulator [Bacteroidales bacterium]|nr:Rrf2 family transcriptional regulator [Bacteroidales bacterium]
MKFNTKTRYGIRTMMEIALQNRSKGVLQKDISQNQNISFKYLDQIISSLKAAGLITNLKGKKSGYTLTRPASQITIYDIHKAFEPDIAIVDCLSEMIDCASENYCAPRDLWEGLNDKVIEYLKNYTLEELAEKQRQYNQKLNQRTN